MCATKSGRLCGLELSTVLVHKVHVILCHLDGGRGSVEENSFDHACSVVNQHIGAWDCRYHSGCEVAYAARYYFFPLLLKSRGISDLGVDWRVEELVLAGEPVGFY